MSDINELIDDARDAATGFLNANERDAGHVALGIAVTVGFALAATLFASGVVRPAKRRLGSDEAPMVEAPRGALGLVLPAMFSATTLSAVRVWNAPPRRERTLAMGLWAAAQAVSAVWIAARPASRAMQIAAAMSSAGLAAAFAHEARKVDVKAGKFASPMGSGTRLANRVDDAVEDRATFH